MIGSGIFQFSQAQVYVFLVEAFVYFSFLANFAITSPVVFAELSILLSYEVFALKFCLQFQSSSNFYPPFCLSQLNFVGAANRF